MEPGSPMEDTVALMLSDDYKDRFIAEYNQLNIRYCNLKDLIDRIHSHDETLDFEPTCPIELLEMQLEAMEQYLKVLRIRGRIEEIVISF